MPGMGRPVEKVRYPALPKLPSRAEGSRIGSIDQKTSHRCHSPIPAAGCYERNSKCVDKALRADVCVFDCVAARGKV